MVYDRSLDFGKSRDALGSARNGLQLINASSLPWRDKLSRYLAHR